VLLAQERLAGADDLGQALLARVQAVELVLERAPHGVVAGLRQALLELLALVLQAFELGPQPLDGLCQLGLVEGQGLEGGGLEGRGLGPLAPLAPGDDGLGDDLDQPGRAGGLGGLLTFFAIGCPTCNKLVVVAIGTTGALDWFAPAQPLLAVVSVGLLGWALRTRLRDADRCRIAAPGTPTGNMSV